jgi:predicted metal-dependent phosphoesterase TrpH
MLVDLHCHTAPLSACSALTPEQLITLARERGLDAICLTEHDRWWAEEERQQLAALLDFPVFAGVELTTDMGHVLAFGLDPAPTSLGTGRAAFEHAQACGGLLYLAHPARDGLLRVTAETIEFFESVEAVNGSDSRLQNMAASGLARGFRLPGIGGSDAHAPEEVGRAATRLARPIRSQADLVAALRQGSYEPCTLP